MNVCDRYDLDQVFKRFEVVEFKTSYVGLSSSQVLNLDVDLRTSVYLKTKCEGKLLQFDKAREISAAHRAFHLNIVDDRTIQVTFHPLNECISRAKRRTHLDNNFIFELRLIQVDGLRCCNDEIHAEIGRYYVSGHYEYLKLSHSPIVINFGTVCINNKVTKVVRIRNESNLIAAKLQYVRVTGFEVLPQKFTIPPNSSVKVAVSVIPRALKIDDIITFEVRNPHLEVINVSNELQKSDSKNFLTYTIKVELNITYKTTLRPIVVESMHTLKDQLPKYTYLNKELEVHEVHKRKALQYLESRKARYIKKPVVEVFTTGRVKCLGVIKPKKNDGKFCEVTVQQASLYDLFDILFLPFFVDFGRVGLNTYGEQVLTIKNKSKYQVHFKLCNDECILYTEDMLSNMTLKLKPSTEITITLFCMGYREGNIKGYFQYSINNLYHRRHAYGLQVGNPALVIKEKCLKFGMVTTEYFVTSVPIALYNYFNIPVTFEWGELNSEIPFEIIPSSGSVPRNSSRVCDIIYVGKPSKSKCHEVELLSRCQSTKTIGIELNIITRKLSIKFLQPAVLFKDIPLNLETSEKVKLENSSREIAFFYIVEPILPGIRIEPMNGIIRPKMIMTFDIIVKISCVLEFAFEIYVKINNKENVVLPISGNIVEPKILIYPKNIYMTRVPCNLITFVPITFQNLSNVRSLVEIVDTGGTHMCGEIGFDIFIAQGNEKHKVVDFYVEGGQTKIVFIRICDIYRREYEQFIPFRINNMLGPPNHKSGSSELSYYTAEYEKQYENNNRVKLKYLNKDISYCRITGVITVPWLLFSVDKFEIDYVTNGHNAIEFTMRNISKYYLFVTIITSKLAPNFTLDLNTEENQSIINENNIKFELDRGKEATFSLKFHPKSHGKFVSTAVLFLDKQMTLPFYNLTFTGRRETPTMTPSSYRIIFPPSRVGTIITKTLTLKIEAISDLNSFSCISKEEVNLTVTFVSEQVTKEEDLYYTTVTVKLDASSRVSYWRNITLVFSHESGSSCDVEVNFFFSQCPITLHTDSYVTPEDNPYPYFPLESHQKLYNYLQRCLSFLEKWMFQQGFRRDLYPVIPDTFHAISSGISNMGTKSKGINVSYLNFVRRIAGPLMKHVRKVTVQGVDDSFKYVKEVHDTYREVIHLIRSRGVNLWILQARFLLSYEQFVIYSENTTLKCNADILLTKELLADRALFLRLNKQCWIDFILQSYKVFVMDSCFFDCVCVVNEPRDNIQILLDWYNEQISLQHKRLRGPNNNTKIITNLTSDLSDGIAIISAILIYCPFLQEHFSPFSEINERTKTGDIINNACLIIDAMNQLRVYFPLTSTDFLQPNFLQMFYLSIHLFIILPMYKPKDTIKFNPPILRSSTRQIAISPSSQESLIFTFLTLNNNKNNFIVEKAPADNGKKMFVSVRYIANFVAEDTCILLLHGYNKTRIFDTYIVFILNGQVGTLNAVRKCKVTSPLYRPNKVDVLVSSPFVNNATFKVFLTDVEPSIPVKFIDTKPNFYVRRLNLIDKEINMLGVPKDGQGAELPEHKLYMQMICLSTQIGNSWIWFRSDLGEFFIRVTTQPRWDIAIDSLQAKVHTWPMDPCSCGESCECYRTTILSIPHRNELMIKSLRYALLEHASDAMMNVFDKLIGTTTGKLILSMLFEEGGTNMSDIKHILRNENTFKITSRALLPRLDRVTLAHHTDAMLALPMTIPANDKSEKYSVTFTSDCGMDIRTYRIFFIETKDDNAYT